MPSGGIVRSKFCALAEILFLESARMSKRRATSSLTGGTGDVNPQFYVIQTTQTAIDTTRTVGFPLPVPKYPGSANRAIVFEVLSVRLMLQDLVVAAGQSFTSLILSTRDLGDTGVANPTNAVTFAARTSPSVVAQRSTDFLFATAVGFQISELRDTEIDCTDAAGHGILVATDNIFFSVYSNATGVVNVAACRIKYRLKEIGLTEYIGIVQSQQ